MNRYEKRSRRSYDKKAEHYDATFDGKFTVRFKEMLCRSVRIREGDAVADVACGNGRLLRMLAGKYTFRGYGVDISEKMVRQAEKHNPDMRFYVAGCDELPFSDQTIDVMTVCAAFHHFPDVQRFAEEAGRVIRQNGTLYIADIYLPAFLRIICNPFMRFSGAGDVRFYGTDEIITLFEHNGFAKSGVEINGQVQLIQLRKL